jgi:hypothetical protein
LYIGKDEGLTWEEKARGRLKDGMTALMLLPHDKKNGTIEPGCSGDALGTRKDL